MIAAVTRAAHRRRSGLPRSTGARGAVGGGLRVLLRRVTAVAGIHSGIFAAMGCYIDAYGARDPVPGGDPAGESFGGLPRGLRRGSAAAGTWAMVGCSPWSPSRPPSSYVPCG
ncbi:hypothetical protein NKH77_51375 [Streptomyces sp. M19]